MQVVRDNTKTFDYYNLALNYRENTLKNFLQNVHDKEHATTPALWAFIQALYFEIADLMFSKGDEPEAIKLVIEKGLETQSIKMAHYRKQKKSLQNALKEETTEDYPEFKRAYAGAASFQHYYSILQILARCIFFNVDKQLFQKYCEDLTIPGADFVFDYLINTQNSNWPVKGKVSYPKKTIQLYEACKATDQNEIETILIHYTSGWRTKLRGHPLFGPHMMKDYNYTGYWCYEAAAVAKLKNSITSNLIELKYFPSFV